MNANVLRGWLLGLAGVTAASAGRPRPPRPDRPRRGARLPPADDLGHAVGARAPAPSAWAALLYLGLGSQFLGFFFWYRGLALAGVVRIGQAQLLQPFITILAAALLLAEPISPLTPLFAALVVLTIWTSSHTKIHSRQ